VELSAGPSSHSEDDGCSYLIDYLKQRADGVEVDEESLLPAVLTASLELEQCAFLSESIEQTELDEFLEIGGMECVHHTELDRTVVPTKTCTITNTAAQSPLQSVENMCQSRPFEQLEGNALYGIMG